MPHPKPHSRYLRSGRWSGSGHVYLVTFTTWKRQRWLAEFLTARLVIQALNKARYAETLAFVVMPDHVHWLMSLHEGGLLSTEVQGVKSVSSHRLNSFLNRKGPIWQPGFHDHGLRNEESLPEVARYIVMNPVRAGLVRSCREYSHWDAIWI